VSLCVSSGQITSNNEVVREPDPLGFILVGVDAAEE
jgi:hypothetical protein